MCAGCRAGEACSPCKTHPAVTPPIDRQERETANPEIRFAVSATYGPNGNRTRVPDVRGRCPRPLDDGTVRSAGGAPSTYDEPGVVPAHVCRMARKPRRDDPMSTELRR